MGSRIEAEEECFAEIDKLAEENTEAGIRAALDLLKAKKVKKGLTSGLYRRAAEFGYFLSKFEKDKKDRVQTWEYAYANATTSLNANPDNLKCAQIMCFICGRLAEEKSLKTIDRMYYGHKFMKYVEESMPFDDQDYQSLHMRGRFSYGIASLSFWERCIGRLFGLIPDLSYHQALGDLKNAFRLNLFKSIENDFFIAKTNLAMGDLVDAKKWLIKTASNTAENPLEQDYIDEARALLEDEKLKSVEI